MEAESLNSRGEFERVRKETFVEAMLLQVADGLASDARYGENSANRIRRRVEDIAYDLEEDEEETSAGRAVLESRFALGHDDSQYLSQAVSLLWAGDGGERLRVVPPALMPEIMRQASADGIVKAMKSVMIKKQAESLGSAKDGLEMAGWLMQMEEVRNAVLDYMKQSQFDVVKLAVKSIKQQYESGDATGMEYVIRLIDDSPGKADNVIISTALLEAVYVLSQEGSHPMRVIDRLVAATKGLVDRASVDSAVVFEIAYALGDLTNDMRIDNFEDTTTAYMDICPQYDDRGTRIADSINTKPSVKQFQSAIDAAFTRVVGQGRSTGGPSAMAGSNVELTSVWSTTRPWQMQRVVSPLWNQGSLLDDESGMADARNDTQYPNERAKLQNLMDARNAALARPSVSVPECRFDRLGNGESIDSMFVAFCMIRGLCGHKGPHQTLVGYGGADPLNYSYPTTKMTKRYRRGRYSLMDGVVLSAKDTTEIFAAQTNVYSQNPDDLELDTDFVAHVECRLRSEKNPSPDDDRFETPLYASYEDARPAMWAPVPRDIGSSKEISYDPTCKRVCEASTYEFMVTSLKARAEVTSDPSQKRLLVAAAACAKLRQVSCMAHIKSVDMSRPEFMSLPSQRKKNQFVTRPCQHCASPEIAFDMNRTLLPVDAGLAMFVNDVDGNDSALAIRAPNDINVAGYKNAQIMRSDGDYESIDQGIVTHWLRAGVERGIDGYPDARDMGRTFGMHLEATPQNEPVDASTVKGKVALEGRGSGLQWLVPSDVNLDTISNLMAASMEAVSNITRIKHEESYISSLDKDGSKERQAIFGLQKSIEDATRDRRASVWSDALREVAISGDRLYRFVTTLTGAIGEAADSAVSWEDEDLKTLSKEAVTRQKALVERVSRFQTKLVESVVGSTLKGSKLQLDVRDQPGKDGALVVLSSDVKDSIRQITDGEAGHGFFEASVELNNIMGRASKPMTISDIVRNLQNVSAEYHDQIAAGMAPSAPASYQRVVEPRNSFMLHLKPDTSAAVQKAFDYITSEMRQCNGYHRHIHMWEFVEGGDWVMTTRFAELAGLMLQNTRMRSGNFAAYVGTSQLISNGHNIRMQIQRLKTQVCYYLAVHMNRPMFLSPDGRMYYFGGSKKPSKRKDGKFTEKQREKRRKNRDAPFGGDDGDDRDDRPGLPSNFPRESVKREVLERMIQHARMRSNLAHQAATDGSNTGRMGVTFKELSDTIKSNKFIPAFGATTEQALEVSRQYLLSTKPTTAAGISMIGKAVMQYSHTAHITEDCKKIFADSEGEIPLQNQLAVSICEDLKSKGHKFSGGYLERPKERVVLSLRRVGWVACYKIKLDTKRHLNGLINQMHKDSYRVERVAYALNTLFGMDKTVGFKAHNPDYDWMPHPNWETATNSSNPNFNVWVKYVSVEDGPFREMMTQVYNEGVFLAWNNKMASMAAATIILFSVMEAAMILEAKDRGGGYMGALFSTLMSHGQAMSAKAAEYTNWFFGKNKPPKPWDKPPPKGMDAEAKDEINDVDRENVFAAYHTRVLELLHIDAEIERIESEAASAGLGKDTTLVLNDLRRQKLYYERRISAYKKAIKDNKIPEELKAELDSVRKSRPNARTLMLAKIMKENKEAVAPTVEDFHSGETVRQASSIAFISAGIAKQLPGVSFNTWLERIGPNFRIYQDGMALGLNATHVLNHDNAGMEKHFADLAKKVANPLEADDWAGMLSGMKVMYWDDDRTEAQRRYDLSQQFLGWSEYYGTRKLASYVVNPDGRPEWKFLDSSTWHSAQSVSARMLSTTALAFLKLKVPDQQKLIVAGIMPYYKLINDADFRESESFAAFLAKPAVRQRLVEDIKLAYGVTSEEDLQKDGVIDEFVAIVERGGIYLVEDLRNLFINGFVTQFINGTKDVDWGTFDPDDFVKRMSDGKDIGGRRVYTSTSSSFASMSMIERPRSSATDLYYSAGKYLVEGVAAGKIDPPPPSALTYDSSRKPYKIGSADPNIRKIFDGVQSGMATDAVMTYLYHTTASKMNILEQKHLSMAGVFLQKVGFGAAIDKAVKDGRDLGDKEDLCGVLLDLNGGIGRAAYVICMALTTAKKPGTAELIYTEENGKITTDVGKLSFNFGEIPAGAPFREIGIDLKEVFDALPEASNRGEDMNNALKYLFNTPANFDWEASPDGGLWKIAVDDRDAWKAQEKANKVTIENGFKASRTLGRSYQSASVQLFLQAFGSVSLDKLPMQEQLGFQGAGTVVPVGPLPDLTGRGMTLTTTPKGNFAPRPTYFADEYHPQFDGTDLSTSISNFFAEGNATNNQNVDELMLSSLAQLRDIASAPAADSASAEEPGGSGTSTRPSGPPATPSGLPPSPPPPGPPPGGPPEARPPSAL